MSNFSSIRQRKMKRNKFNLSHEVKLSCDMAELVPVYLDEIVPGDKFSVRSEALVRLAPLISPIMHRVSVYIHYFFVPNRIIWDNWKDFITGGEDGTYQNTIPKLTINESVKSFFAKGKLSDYLGIPAVDQASTVLGDHQINSLPFRAYQEIYQEYYRDQNLQEKANWSKGDNSDSYLAALTKMRTRAWEKDYFTSSLPWAQKGDPITAPIEMGFREPALFKTTPGGNLTDAGNISSLSDGRASHDVDGMVSIDNIDPQSTGIDVNELRTATKLQQWLEKNARAGSRYVESILAHFQERVPDYTADRPIYLGGGRQPVTISEVLQTAETGTTAQGNMAGHGISAGAKANFTSKFTEHGYVMGIMSVLPRTAYSQGTERKWTKSDKFDLYWPEFAQLGEQPVQNKELYLDYTDDTGLNDETFGYQARYAEYRQAQSRIAGDFRDNLAHWHLGRFFDSTPYLNSTFIQADPREDIFAVTNSEVDKLWVQVYNNVQALRRMPKYNVPSL